MKKQADSFQPPNEPIPEGLAYRQEYWDGALSLIRQRERRALLWRSFFGALLAVFITGASLGCYYLWPANGMQVAQVGPELQQLRNPQQALTSDSGMQTTTYASSQLYPAADAEETRASGTTGANASSAGAIHTTHDQASAHSGSARSATTQAQARGADATTFGPWQAPGAASTSSTPSDYGNQPSASGSDTYPAAGTTAVADSVIQFEIEPSEAVAVSVDSSVNDHPTRSIVANGEPATPAGTSESRNALPFVGAFALARAINFAHTAHHPKLLALNNVAEPLSVFPTRPYSAHFRVGTSVLPGYGAASSSAVNPSLALTLERHFDPTWSVFLGAEYFSIGGVFLSHRIEESNELGTEFEVNLIRTNRLHYFSLPVGLAMRFGDRHQLTWNAGLSVLAQAEQTNFVGSYVSSDTHEIEDITLFEGVEGTPTVGYLNGFRALNAYVGMGYNYEINNRVGAGALFQYGLNDITHNHFEKFDQHAFDRNSRVVLFVRMNVW